MPRPRLRVSMVLLTVIALSGCTSARVRLERGLVRVGVDRPVAACMAGQMSDHLSVSQLRRIGQLRRLDDDIARGLTLDRFLADVRALGDPEIVAVSAAAGAICWALHPRAERREPRRTTASASSHGP